MTQTFRAITWNVYHGTSPKELRPLMEARLKEGVTVFLLQEVTVHRGVLELLQELGLDFFFHAPQYVVAWVPLKEDRPDGWAAVPLSGQGVRLSPTSYHGKVSDQTYSEAARVFLVDRWGRTLDTLSYHTPATVQRGGPNPKALARVQALRESMATMGRLARRAKTTAVLYGGDDNVDERQGPAGVWRFMLRVATGLRQVVAPKATHGRRKIDDFRVRRLAPVKGEGRVHPGGGDHRAFSQEFRWL